METELCAKGLRGHMHIRIWEKAPGCNATGQFLLPTLGPILDYHQSHAPHPTVHSRVLMSGDETKGWAFDVELDMGSADFSLENNLSPEIMRW